MLSLLSAIEDRPNKLELVSLTATTMHMMSETSGCRIEMIQKGGLDIINSILPHAEDDSLAVAMKALHNVMKYPTSSQSAFELCCEISCTACRISDNPVVLGMSLRVFITSVGAVYEG